MYFLPGYESPSTCLEVDRSRCSCPRLRIQHRFGSQVAIRHGLRFQPWNILSIGRFEAIKNKSMIQGTKFRKWAVGTVLKDPFFFLLISFSFLTDLQVGLAGSTWFSPTPWNSHCSTQATSRWCKPAWTLWGCDSWQVILSIDLSLWAPPETLEKQSQFGASKEMTSPFSGFWPCSMTCFEKIAVAAWPALLFLRYSYQ